MLNSTLQVTGVYGGYSDWAERAGRFRSLGDGQVDFKAVFPPNFGPIWIRWSSAPRVGMLH